jgi:hypothetical protein
MRPKYDILWKGLMEELMGDLLLFVEPEIGKELALGRGFEFLDKELAQMFPEPANGGLEDFYEKLKELGQRCGMGAMPEHFIVCRISLLFPGRY